MKKWAVRILVVVALVALALVLRGRHSLPEKPETTVKEFFDAASRGDDGAYLRLVTGELRKSLVNTKSQLGAKAFRESLQRTASGIKGLAVTRGDDAPLDLVAIEVDIVFVDRNERQRILLANKGNGWAITSIDAAIMSKPPIPYGTPVFGELEEDTQPPVDQDQPDPGG